MNEFLNKLFLLLKQIILEGNIFFITADIIKIISYYLAPIFLIILSIVLYNLDLYLHYDFAVGLGNLGLFLFAAILYVKPLSRILPEIKLFQTLLRYRRQFGILCFYVLFFHGLNLIIALGLLSKITTLLDYKQNFLWGVLGLGVLFLLYVTSNNVAVRFFKQKWKTIQRIAYLGFLFSIIHVTFLEGFEYIPLVIIYLIFKGLEWKKIQLIFINKMLDKIT